MSTAPLLRLYLFFATENDRALILRRSGRALYNLIGWDRRTDTFTEGQWLKKPLYAEEAKLSPDGTHFIYTVHNAHPDTRASSHYTVLSRAPWFTALALFPHGAAWQSGGYFLSNTLYRINAEGAADIIGRDEGLHRVVQGEVSKDCRTGLRLLNGQPAPLSRAQRDQLLTGVEPPRETAMDRYETQAGRLYRRRGEEFTLIRDFTEMTPVYTPAPYSDPETGNVSQTWHPLDDEAAR